jgi:hypothetical protein
MQGAIAALLLGLSALGAAAPGRAQTVVAVDAEIVLAVDASASVDGSEREVQRQGYQLALRHPDFVRAVGVGRHGRIALSYFEWSGQVQRGALVPWRVIGTAADAVEFADAIASLPITSFYGTSIARAIDFAADSIRDNAFDGADRIIDVSGDGPNNIGPPVAAARDRAVAEGITINGLPILLRPSRSVARLDRYYEDCVIGGVGAFLLPVQTAEQLAPTILAKLILEVSGTRPEALVPAALDAPMDCLAGEKHRRERLAPFYPGLYE